MRATSWLARLPRVSGHSLRLSILPSFPCVRNRTQNRHMGGILHFDVSRKGDNAMKYLWLVAFLLMGCVQAADFDPTFLSDSVKITEGFCEPYHCVLVVKDDKTYVIATDDRGRLVRVWEVIGDDFSLLWDRELV